MTRPATLMRTVLPGVALMLALVMPFTVHAELRIADATLAGDAAVRQLALEQGLAGRIDAIQYDRLTTSEAVAKLLAGEVDFALVEQSRLPAEFAGEALVYAVDALVFYVNTGNTLDEITLPQLRTIFTAAEPRWEDYSFLSSPVRRFAVKYDRPGAARFRQLLLPNEGTEESPTTGDALAAGVQRFDSTAEVLLMAGADPAGIGFGLFMPTAPVQVKALRVGGVLPTLRTVREGTYPLAAPRMLLIRDRAALSADAAAFYQLMTMRKFRVLIEEAGMLPVDLPDPVEDTSRVP